MYSEIVYIKNAHASNTKSCFINCKLFSLFTYNLRQNCIVFFKPV